MVQTRRFGRIVRRQADNHEWKCGIDQQRHWCYIRVIVLRTQAKRDGVVDSGRRVFDVLGRWLNKDRYIVGKKLKKRIPQCLLRIDAFEPSPGQLYECMNAMRVCV